MALSVVQSTSVYPGGSGNNATKAFTSNVVAGNVIVCMVGWNASSGNATVTTTVGTTSAWTQVTGTGQAGTSTRAQIYWATVTTSGACTVKVQFGSTLDFGFHIAELGGVDTTTPVNTQNTGSLTTNATTATTGSITTTNADTLVIAFTADEAVAASYTLDKIFGTSANAVQFLSSHESRSEYLILSSTGTGTGSFGCSASPSRATAMMIVAFQAASAGGGSTFPPVPSVTIRPILFPLLAQ
jgi:hypothetical protein